MAVHEIPLGCIFTFMWRGPRSARRAFFDYPTYPSTYSLPGAIREFLDSFGNLPGLARDANRLKDQDHWKERSEQQPTARKRNVGDEV